MKKILNLLFICTVLGFVACDGDEATPSAPTVTVDPTTAQDVPGATVTVGVSVTAPGGAKQIVLSGGATQTITLAGQASVEQDVEILIPANAVVGSTIPVVITATDNNNLSSSPVTLVITVGDPVVQLTGSIAANRELLSGTSYLLKGQVFVESGVTLTIPAGVVIKGDKVTKGTLVVKPGGKLVANGTAASPVVFTSNQAAGARDRGDWGGVILLGNAFVNQASKPSIEGISPAVPYGTAVGAPDNGTPSSNATENSGTLTYVRIEYAGIELTPNNETNSLTMGGVGNGTTINNVQASFGGDDGFEWFGGTVNAKNLISFGTWDDDFDTDFGFGGNVQYGLVVRYPTYADQSESNSFESDNQANGNTIAGVCDGTTQAGCTRAIFSNITVLGARDFTTGLGGAGTSARSISGNNRNAIHIRRRTAISIFNSFFAGFPVGVRVDDQGTLDNLTAGAGVHKFNVLASPNTTVIGSTTTQNNAAFATNIGTGDATVVSTYWTDNGNTVINPTGAAGWSPNPGTPANSINPYTDLGITSTLFFGSNLIGAYPTPNFAVASGTLSTGADYANAKFNGNAFFTTTGTFRGAFGATDWTDGWAEFQPLNKAY